MKKLFISIIVLAFTASWSYAQDRVLRAPEVKEGDGPYTQLIIRGITLIDGTGAPPIGPIDIEIKGNRITKIQTVGYPGVAINQDGRPKLEAGGKELNCEGMYAMPGFVDMHGHIGGSQAPMAEYVFKLWMAHGITTVRDPSAGNGLDWVLDQKQKSAKNLITAPRIHAYTAFGMGSKEKITTAEQARAWVNENKAKGADGIKFFGASPVVMDAALRENKRLGLRSACHHAQMDVARWNVVKSAEAGLT
ncbi:MAG: amidohydrolase, partial [Cyclobacteriaceae bacterium]|nr:amidohydrolase [Cyclobacteriaceae bacterium]